jgi:hypothetical protein
MIYMIYVIWWYETYSGGIVMDSNADIWQYVCEQRNLHASNYTPSKPLPSVRLIPLISLGIVITWNPQVHEVSKFPIFKHHCKRLAPGLLGFWLPRCESIASQRGVYHPAQLSESELWQLWPSWSPPGSDKRSASPQVSHSLAPSRWSAADHSFDSSTAGCDPESTFCITKHVWFPLVSKLQSWFGEGGFNMFNPHGK